MSLAIQAANNAFYTAMSHNAAYSMMNINAARMGLLGSNNLSFGALHAMDQRLTLQSLKDSLTYKIAETILENQKAAQKKQNKLNVLA